MALTCAYRGTQALDGGLTGHHQGVPREASGPGPATPRAPPTPPTDPT